MSPLPAPARAPLRWPRPETSSAGTAGADDARGRGPVLAGPLLCRLGPPRGQPDCPRCHRDGQRAARTWQRSGGCAWRHVIPGRRRHPWTLREPLIGVGPGGRPSFSAAVDGHRSRQRTRPRPTPAWSSFTSPARRVDHQVQLRRRSGDGCPPRPAAPRKWTTHTGIPMRRRREQSNDRSRVPIAVAAQDGDHHGRPAWTTGPGCWPRRGRDRAGIGPPRGQPRGVEWADQPDRPLATR